jgi:hypothetical protein
LRLRWPGARPGLGAALIASTGYFAVAAAAAPAASPAPVIRQYPADPTYATIAAFTYTDAAAHVIFHCFLNSPPAAKCSPAGIRYVLPRGRWCFYVYVTTAAGQRSRPAQYCWTILYRPPPPPPRHHHRHRPRPATFTVGGDLAQPLFPGVSEPLDLMFSNPNRDPITIPAGAITSANITITTNAAACSPSNFAVSQGLTVSVTIPARTSVPVSLLSLGVSRADWPVITMFNTSTNQDACQGAALTLHYTGIEASG